MILNETFNSSVTQSAVTITPSSTNVEQNNVWSIPIRDCVNLSGGEENDRWSISQSYNYDIGVEFESTAHLDRFLDKYHGDASTHREVTSFIGETMGESLRNEISRDSTALHGSDSTIALSLLAAKDEQTKNAITEDVHTGINPNTLAEIENILPDIDLFMKIAFSGSGITGVRLIDIGGTQDFGCDVQSPQDLRNRPLDNQSPIYAADKGGSSGPSGMGG